MSKMILIGGVPRTGKTTLAQRIATESNRSWLSTDVLEAIVHPYVPPTEQVKKFPKSRMRRETNRSNDKFYSIYTTEEIIDSYQVQAATATEAIRAFVQYVQKEDWSYVLEGYHVTPSLISELQINGTDVRAVILINSAPEVALEQSMNSKVKNDWVRDNTSDEETLERICAGIRRHSELLKQEAADYGVQCFDVGQDFSSVTNEVYRLLSE